MVPRKQKDENKQEFSPWQVEVFSLLADVHSHVSVGENSMAADVLAQLSEMFSGKARIDGMVMPYQVHTRWRSEGQICNRMVLVETPTRTLANQTAAAIIKDAFALDNLTGVSTVVVPIGTVLEDETELPTDEPPAVAGEAEDAA